MAREKPWFMSHRDLPKGFKTLPAVIPEIIGLPKVPDQEACLRRHVGIEIEVEDCGVEPFGAFKGIADHWHVERDPSLRGKDSYEFKTPMPTTCWDAHNALRHFFSMVNLLRANKKAKFNFSERTSIHVHVDVRDLTESQIKALTKMYLIFEKSLFDLVGRERAHNIFCIPLCESAFCDLQRGAKWYQFWEKYCAINMSTLTNYGTVEFRAMAGNDNLPLISAWVMMLTSLVEYARRTGLEKIEAKINELKMESQYMILAEEVFGRDLAANLTMFPEASDMAASLTKQF